MNKIDISQLDMKNIPNHIAVIMDGNGRWATRKGLKRLDGHVKGYSVLKDFVFSAAEIGVKAITAYAFSSENWSRPKEEVEGLMKLIAYAAKAELDEMNTQGVKMITSGRTEMLPDFLKEQFAENEAKTKNNTKIILNLAVNYGGRNEIVDAAIHLAKIIKRGDIQPEDIDEKLISNLMYHPELKDPDLLIRTAGEMRLSNFLLWQTAYTELYITETLWPDFNKDELIRAIYSYQNRTRKFGGVVEEE
ncbi:MAG: isoprenyl transferase [Armatimonadota bacterium]